MIRLERGERPDGDQGAVAIEFALVLPILVVLVFGIFQFGLYFNRQQGIHAAAREGARVAALSETTSDDVISRVDSALNGISLPNGRTITITAPGYSFTTTGSSGDGAAPCEGNFAESVVVTVTADTEFEIPLWGSGTFTITGEGDFRCESG